MNTTHQTTVQPARAITTPATAKSLSAHDEFVALLQANDKARRDALKPTPLPEGTDLSKLSPFELAKLGLQMGENRA